MVVCVVRREGDRIFKFVLRNRPATDTNVYIIFHLDVHSCKREILHCTLDLYK